MVHEGRGARYASRAQLGLGVLYRDGQGVPQDYVEAAEWFPKTPQTGDADAEYNLTLLYGDGNGMPQDIDQAEQWYRKAAEHGQTDAQVNLGLLLATRSEGFLRQIEEAYFWLDIAAASAYKLLNVG